MIDDSNNTSAMAVSSHVNEDGHTEINIDGEAFIQVCTTCSTPIPFYQSTDLDEYGNCVNCQGVFYA